MEQVLYTKYNSLRRPEYRIVTEIRQKDGEKYVVKRAECPEAEPQTARILQNGELLKDYYRGILVLPAEKLAGGVRFPFVRGISLKEKILREPYEKENFIRLVNDCLDRTMDVREDARCPFARTEEFERWFGKADPGTVPAICPANIDTLPDNYVENTEGLTCLDYEWVCNFPVPTGYIRYRVLLYLHSDLSRSLLDGVEREEFMGWFGLSEKEQAVYWEMEDAFQQKVHGEERHYQYTDQYRKKSPVLHDILSENQWQRQSIETKNQHIDNLEQILENKTQQIELMDRSLNDQKRQIRTQEQHIDSLTGHIVNLEHLLEDERREHAAADARYLQISRSVYWRMTLPMRKVTGGIKKLLSRNDNFYLALRTFRCRMTCGKEEAEKRKRDYLKERRQNSWYKLITEEAWDAQHGTVFPRKITFSILVPLFNTPEFFLEEMIRSVQNQSYSNWELCLADGSDREHKYVRKICRRAARKDKRIRYRKLKENTGISGNTNACIEMATGEYIALFDHDDYLHPSALYEVMRTICETGADFVYTDENTFHETPPDAFNPHFKPDFAPDTLRANNYICHLTVFDRQLLKTAGCFRPAFDGSQDFDLVLRLTEQARKIAHIPKVLYYWRAHRGSVAETVEAKPYVVDAAKKAIREHLERVGLQGEVLDSRVVSMYRLKYRIEGNPLISIIIPSFDHADDLKRCIDSIREKTTYGNYEIVIVENNSKEPATFEYYKALEKDKRIRVVKWDGIFNFSGICNYGVKHSKGEHVLLLNNDVEIISPDWIQEMLMYSQRKDVGAVGAKLYYPDGTIQHAGIGIGLLTLAGHYHRHFGREHPGYMGRLSYAQDVTAVTGACMMIRRDVYEETGGYDESFEVAFNDVDFCMRVRQAGYLVVFTPFAELYHYESKSRGLDDAPEKRARFLGEIERFQKRWEKELAAGDPYYNPNFSVEKEDFSVKQQESRG